MGPDSAKRVLHRNLTRRYIGVLSVNERLVSKLKFLYALPIVVKIFVQRCTAQYNDVEHNIIVHGKFSEVLILYDALHYEIYDHTPTIRK